MLGNPHPAPSSAQGHSCQWTWLPAVLGQQHPFAVLRTHDEDRQWQLPAAVVWSHLPRRWSKVQFCSPNLQETTQGGPRLRWRVLCHCGVGNGSVGDHNFHGATRGSFSGQRADVLRELFCKPEREIAGYLPKHFFHCINCIPQPQFSCDRHKKALRMP